jgi:hypothetical protein
MQSKMEPSYNQDAQGSVTFPASNHGWCDYVLEIGFISLRNAKADHDLLFRGEIKPLFTEITKPDLINLFKPLY